MDMERSCVLPIVRRSPAVPVGNDSKAERCPDATRFPEVRRSNLVGKDGAWFVDSGAGGARVNVAGGRGS